MKCVKCKKYEIAFVSPGKWCTICWADWWFRKDEIGLSQKDIDELEKERTEFLLSEGVDEEALRQAENLMWNKKSLTN